MISSPIVPAVIPTSLAHLRAQLVALGSIPELHLDVVDGVFVPNISWPYTENDTSLQSVRTVLDAYTLEVDLMVSNPLPAAHSWIAEGADRLVFHVETISAADFKQFADRVSVTVGIAANNDTAFEELEQYFPAADFVQVMGIAQIGAQGQPFDTRARKRIATLRERYPNLALSLDGSVNVQTLSELLALRLDRYIMGSAIMAVEDPHRAYEEFSKQARSSQQG